MKEVVSGSTKEKMYEKSLVHSLVRELISKCNYKESLIRLTLHWLVMVLLEDMNN